MEATESWVPCGTRIGWIDRDGIYLEPDAAFAAVQQLAREQNSAIVVTANVLWKRLREKGHIASTGAKNRLKVQKLIEGARRYVVHIHFSSLLDPVDDPLE